MISALILCNDVQRRVLHVVSMFCISFVLESCDLNPIEMVWNQLKRYVVKSQPQNKDELIKCINEFWVTTLTPEICNRYINHVFKVAPLVVRMNGKATGDMPNRLFNERSDGKSMQHFVELLEIEDMNRKLQRLLEDQENNQVPLT